MRTFIKTQFLAWKKFENHTLIIDSRTNKQVHRLNEIGAFLWNLLDEISNEEELVQVLMKNYEVDETNAKEDVNVFLKALLAKGLIHE
jgi:hypothetical protein